MASPAEVVANAFSQAQTYANSAETKLEVFTDALSLALYTAPAFDVTFQPIAAPTALAIPARPTALDTLEPEFVWDAAGDIAATKPTALALTAPTLVIDGFTDTMEALDYGVKPVLDFGTKPTVPAVATVTVPDAPTLTTVALPSLLTLTTPTFAGVDLHVAFLTNLETVPTLSLVAPTPFSYALGADYASTLLTTVKAKLLERLTGGSGIDTAVEQAIWDRARTRETQIGAANEADVARQSEALGWHLPAGVTAAQLRAAQQDTFDKLSTLSRDVAIKQADLEQANMKDTIASVMALESKLLDRALELEKLSFEASKMVAENALAIYNAQVDEFKALISAYQVYAAAYRAIIDGELAKVEVYKAQLQGEETKATVNRSLVEQYKAQIEAGLAQVKIFEAQVSGAQARMQLEESKLRAVGAEIQAYVAGINGETARLEAWKVGVQGELGKVEVFRAKAQAFSAKAGAQADEARAQVSYYQALVGAKSAEWDGWRARVQGETARFQALGIKSNAVLDGYRAEMNGVLATVEQDTKRWSVQIAQYEALQTYTIQAQKMNTEVIQANKQATLDAAKAGAQVYAQLTSSAYGLIHASAGVSASAGNSASTSVSYSYSNDTSTSPTTVTVVPPV